MTRREVGDVLLSVEDVWLSFGGVKAIQGVSFDVREHEIRAIIGPNGAGKSSMLNVINGVYHPQQGRITYRGKVRSAMDPHHAAAQGFGRTFQSLALFKGMSVLDNIMTGRGLRMRTGLLAQAINIWARAARGTAPPRVRREHHRFPRDPGRTARRRSADCRTGCRSALTSPGRWRWNHRSCCSTSRWPA